MSTFTDAIDRELKGLRYSGSGPVPECCPTCEDVDWTEDDDGTPIDEGSFHWTACDSCGSTLGGDRHAAHAFDDKKEIYHLEICTDCLMFLENGEEPDCN